MCFFALTHTQGPRWDNKDKSLLFTIAYEAATTLYSHIPPYQPELSSPKSSLFRISLLNRDLSFFSFFFFSHHPIFAI